MRISFIEPHLKLVGGIRRILEISNHLVERGHDVTIFHPEGSPCDWMEGKAATAPAEAVLDDIHDVLVFNDPNSRDVRLAIEAQARVKIHYALRLYEMDLLRGIKPAFFYKPHPRTRRLKKLLKSSAVQVVNATWMVNWLWENMRIRTDLLLGGVNRDMFHPVDVPKCDQGIRILCSGDPRANKGTDVVQKAVDLARESEPAIVVDTYYGQGIPQSEMAAKYCAADIFLDAQRPSGCGWNNPVAEAMACKVPVICTDIGGVRDFAFDGDTARLVPVDTPDAMSRVILELIKNSDERRRLAENGYKRILGFRWDESAREFERLANSYIERLE